MIQLKEIYLDGQIIRAKDTKNDWYVFFKGVWQTELGDKVEKDGHNESGRWVKNGGNQWKQ